MENGVIRDQVTGQRAAVGWGCMKARAELVWGMIYHFFFFAIVREHCGSDTFNRRHLSLILVAGETKIKMLAALGLAEDLFLLSRWLPYFCAITWWQA